MIRGFFFLSIWLMAITSFTQCLTDFTKLLPEPSMDYSQDFGRSVAMYDQFMAVGVPNSDSLGRLTGIVYMYEKVDDIWIKIAAMAPSVPIAAMQFGVNLVLSQNYLVVSSLNYGGKVYIFKKGAAGWTSQTEFGSLNMSESIYFGANPYGNSSIAISTDEQTLAITDINAPVTAATTIPYYQGAIYVYHKQSFQDWNSPISPTRIIAPGGNIADFGRGGVALYGNHLVTGTPYTAAGGNLYVYNDPTGTFANFTLQATLRPTNTASYFLGYYNLVFSHDGIFTPGTESINGESKYGIIFFEKPATGNWLDATPTCFIPSTSGMSKIGIGKIFISSNGTDILASVQTTDGQGFFNLLKKGINGWCEVDYQNLDTAQAISGMPNNPYGIINACNQQTDAVLGFVSIPENINATLALKTFSNNGISWVTNLIYPKKKSTAGHLYGRTVVGYDNHLFVAAPKDGTQLPGVGAVYYYEKDGKNWNKKGKILAPSRSRYDDFFGSALATNKKYLAVGALSFESGHSAYGRVFIYRKIATGWANAELVQEIALPEDQLIVYSYGDNLAMSEEWLIIPYVQNSPYRIMLAIYRFDGIQWNYFQAVEAGFGNFFARSTTIAVAIEGETLLAGNLIFERNQKGEWVNNYILSPSDPESIQIAPDFSHLVTNGSMFGHSNSIKDNTVFIGAPTKDHQGIWDVGAVYVYTKKPGESWSSRTETSKLLPRITDEGELFGYALQNSGNTLLVGAPGADYKKDGVTARSKPGRAYVFQSRDYFWQDVVRLIDFTGDSFAKDYYGLQVYMDESDFFIGAPIDDIETGKLSGSVYITPSPPIVRLVPPVCSSESVIDLFGYPFGGTWSGPGIIDVTEGLFDPKIAGKGVHEFRYRTPSCLYEGILRIEVEDPPLAILVTEKDMKVCRDKSFSINLAVEEEIGAYYSWYFRANANQSFASLEIRSPSMVARVRGEYKLKVYRSACMVFTPIISITDEVVDIEVMQPTKACERSATPVPLLANPTGGVWSGPGVNNNNFSAANFGAGIYKTTYHYTSSLGCIFVGDANVIVVPVFIPVVNRVQGNLCSDGEVKLAVQESPPAGTQLTWSLTDAIGTHALDGNNSSIVITQQGIYTVVADNGVCKVHSQPMTINDQLIVNLQPSVNFLEACAEDKVSLTVSEPRNASYIWLFSSSNSGTFEQLPTKANALDVIQSGYYKLSLSRGICEYQSDPKQIVIHPKDSIFMPNVFTPNGDDKNEVLKVSGTVTDAQLLVLNRYGNRMFEGSALQGWKGEDASTGTYFWLVQYMTCQQETKTLKGSVQLIR